MTEQELADKLARALYGEFLGKAVEMTPEPDEVLGELNRGSYGDERETATMMALEAWAYARKGKGSA